MSEQLKKVLIHALSVNAGKRLTFRLPEELYKEVLRVSGGRVSAWLRDLVQRAIEEERRKALLETLPEELRERLLERAGGNEREAAKLALRLLNLALEEEEEEEAAQEAIGYANKMETAREKGERVRALG
jgi:hypothetical protein